MTPIAAEPMSKRRRWLLALGVLAALLAAAGVALALGFEPWLRGRIQAEARKHGAEVDFADYQLSLSELVLQGVRFSSNRPVPTVGEIEQLRISLQNFRPTAVFAQSATVEATASVEELLARLQQPARHEATGAPAELPLSVTDLHVSWKPNASSEPLLTLGEGKLELGGQRESLAGVFTAGGSLIGTTQLQWDRTEHRMSFDVVFGGLALPHISGTVQAGNDPLLIDVLVHEAVIGPLIALYTGHAEFARTLLSGKLSLHWPVGLSTRGPGGKIYLTLENFEPPHPPELQGFDFGKQTDIESDFSISNNHRQLTLENLRVQAGSFALTGGGKVNAASAELKLNGSLSCVALAQALATAELGSLFGHWAGKLAKRHLEGSVGFAIELALDLNAARPSPSVQKHIVPGCGLKPLERTDLPTLRQLGVDLRELEADLRQAIPELQALPPAPNLLPDGLQLPALPQLPGFKQLQEPAAQPVPGASAAPQAAGGTGNRP
jgi:hypothetical protein